MKYHQHPTHRSKAYRKRYYPLNFPTRPLDQNGESTAASSSKQDDKTSAVMKKPFSKLGTWQGSRKHFLKRKPHLNKPTPPHLHLQVGVPFPFTRFVQTTTNKGELGRKEMRRTLARRPFLPCPARQQPQLLPPPPAVEPERTWNAPPPGHDESCSPPPTSVC